MPAATTKRTHGRPRPARHKSPGQTRPAPGHDNGPRFQAEGRGRDPSQLTVSRSCWQTEQLVNPAASAAAIVIVSTPVSPAPLISGQAVLW